MVIIILLALNSLLFPVGEIKRFQRTPHELYEKIKIEAAEYKVVDFVDLLFYVHGKHLRSCRDGQLT